MPVFGSSFRYDDDHDATFVCVCMLRIGQCGTRATRSKRHECVCVTIDTSFDIYLHVIHISLFLFRIFLFLTTTTIMLLG